MKNCNIYFSSVILYIVLNWIYILLKIERCAFNWSYLLLLRNNTFITAFINPIKVTIQKCLFVFWNFLWKLTKLKQPFLDNLRFQPQLPKECQWVDQERDLWDWSGLDTSPGLRWFWLLTLSYDSDRDRKGHEVHWLWLGPWGTSGQWQEHHWARSSATGAAWERELWNWAILGHWQL